MTETFRFVKNNNAYSVSNTGKIKSNKNNHILAVTITNGYHRLGLSKNKKRKNWKVCRLVAEAFVHNDDPINKTFVNHIDGDKLNDNATNLEFVTPSENNHHANRTNF